MCLCEYVSDVARRKSTTEKGRGTTIDGGGQVRTDKKALVESTQERVLAFLRSYHVKSPTKCLRVGRLEDDTNENIQ